jgi:vancomycin resistance protein VanW
MKKRRLFCEISPFTYKISQEKEILKRRIKNLLQNAGFARTKSEELLPVLIQTHKSLIRRRLGNVDLQLQENKAKSLSIAAPKVTNILVKPNEIFSFWKLVGRTSKRKGYLKGMTIENGQATSGIGGGMCQFTNLLHWLILHTDLDILEHHHHNELDLFPDFKRQIPFGTGTSIVYNYLDYRFKNNTDKTYQIIVYTDEKYLCGEIRATSPLQIKVHIREEDAYLYEQDGEIYRHNKIYRKVVDKTTGSTIEDKLLLENNSKVMYDKALINKELIRI